MKSETKNKLEKLSTTVVVKWGKDIINFDNFLTILKKEADANGINLHFNTIKLHLNYIVSCIKKAKNDFLELEPNNEIIVETETKKELIKIKLMFSDGSFDYFIPEGKVEPNTDTNPVVKEPEWTGLFNYNSDGSIVIRRGKYAGCDITSKSSIMQKFKGLAWYEKWCRGRIDDVKAGRIAMMPDTPRDMEVLEKIIKRIVEIKDDKLF